MTKELFMQLVNDASTEILQFSTELGRTVIQLRVQGCIVRITLDNDMCGTPLDSIIYAIDKDVVMIDKIAIIRQ